MEDKKNTIMIDGVEITKETYEKIRKDAFEEYTKETIEKIRKDAFEEYKMEIQQLSDDKVKRIAKEAIEENNLEMARSVVKKEYQCYVCKLLPRPGNKSMKKCTYCTKLFCDTCGSKSHSCSGTSRTPNSSLQLTLPIYLEVDRYLPYFCKNGKFGCEENFLRQEELFDHEKYCDYQEIHCAEISCKEKVVFLKYLDHLKEKHSNCQDLDTGKTHKVPIDFDKVQNIQICFDAATCKGKPSETSTSFKKCGRCLKIFCCQGNSKYGGSNKCGYHLCSVSGLWASASLTFETSWFPKKFTAFGKTFFEVGIIRNNIIYKWLYILALPHEAKHFFYRATVKSPIGEKVLISLDQAQSLFYPYEDVIKNLQIMIGYKTAKKLVMEGTNQVDYSVKIRNLKEEAKDDDEESGIED